MAKVDFEKVNLNELAQTLVDLYGVYFVFVVIFIVIVIFVLFVLFLYIKSKGWIKTPSDKSLENIDVNIDEIKTGYIESYTKMFELLERFSKTQDSKLRVDQVDDVANLYRKLYEYEIIHKLEEIFIVNNIDNNKEKVITKVMDELHIMIFKNDKLFYNLPNVESCMLSQEDKIKSIDRKFLTRIYEIMIESDHDVETFRRNIQSYIQVFILSEWKIK